MMRHSPADQSHARRSGFGWAHLFGFLLVDALMALALIVMLTTTLSNDVEIPATEVVDEVALAQALASVAPSLPDEPDTPEASPTPEPTATAIPTPTRAPASPARSQPTATSAARAQPTPTKVPSPTPTKPALLPWPQTLNIVLLGSDKRPNERGWRTDTIIIVAINPDAKQVGVISVPRDLWVQLPNYANRINTLDALGGPNLLKQTLQTQLGIPIHYYARMDFNGFVRAIDTLGGITVEVECRLYETGHELGTLDIPAGSVQMNGRTALAFARSRLTTSDFDRMRRQQAVLLAVRKKLLSPELLPRLPELVTNLSAMTQTDIPPKTLLALARLGSEIDLKNVHAFLLDERIVRPYTTANGAAVQLAEPSKVQNGVQNLWSAPALTDAIKRRGTCQK